MTHYYVGDIPAEDVVIEPARGEEPIDLTPFGQGTVSVDLTTPAGEPAPSSGFLGTIQDGRLVIEWPADTVLTTAGLYALRVTLHAPDDGPTERLAPVLIVVEDPTGWVTLEQARDEWADARAISDVKLWRLLDIARIQVAAFAPTIPTPIPSNLIEAQLMQARNIWNAGRVSPSGEVGGDTFAITPHPLDWQIKQLIRPRRGTPVIG